MMGFELFRLNAFLSHAQLHFLVDPELSMTRQALFHQLTRKLC